MQKFNIPMVVAILGAAMSFVGFSYITNALDVGLKEYGPTLLSQSNWVLSFSFGVIVVGVSVYYGFRKL